jgi:glycosyltransferase involved in cell wall biosynthesis
LDVRRAGAAEGLSSRGPHLPIRHVALNAVFFEGELGGLETYVRQLVPALARLRPDLRFSVYANEAACPRLRGEPWAADVEIVGHPLLGRRYTRALTELTLLGKLASRARVDVLHSVAMTGPWRTSAVHVVTLGDLIWLRHPETTGRLTTTVWKLVVPPVARRARRLLTFSEASRRDAVELLGLPSSKIDVVPLGPGLAGVEPTSEADLRRLLDLGDGPAVLTVSAKKPHKNLVRVVRALPLVLRRVPNAVLVMPGAPTAHEEELRSEAARLGLEETVRLPGFVDEHDLEGLYRLASCVVVPSLYEGFGLPVLEAMGRGTPVACSDVSSLPEVAGDAARYFDPRSESEIGQAIIDLLTDGALVARLNDASSVRARMFDWETTAGGTLETYERAWTAARR